ncbi:MAG: vitamin K epoxide reductase family protein [Solirubrobacterales bacterium]
MRAVRHFLPWVGVLVAFGVLISVLPDTTAESIAITQIPLIPVSGLVIFSFFRTGPLPEAAARVTVALVALAGMSFAAYLASKWASGELPTCSTGGCTAAQYSDGADLFFGIRTTTVGLTGYSLVLLSLLVPGNAGRFITAFLGTFGFGTSMYLTFYSVTELETTCQWCIGSATAMTTIMVLSYWRLVKYME